ncbi:MAG: VCBS repeat-containing protein, partial [Aldersonia sp.]|nr:VCBS repeat-containing protein [Aldersonia sp.]
MSTTTIADPKPLPWRLIDAADLDGDGKADLVLRHPGTGALEVWLMDGAIVRSRTAVATVPEPHRRVVSVTDISGDGKADLVLQNMSSGALDVWTMSGAAVTSTSALGTIDRRWHVSSPIRYRHVHTHSDFNGDGNADLLLRHATTNQVATWELNGRTPPLRSDSFTTVASAAWKFEQLGAFSGDSLSDVQLRNVNDGMVAFWEFNGQSLLNSDGVATLPAGTWAAVAAGDFDGDGNSDVVFRNATTFELILWKMRGHALIEAVSVGTLPSSSWIVAGAGDLNGDGRDDLVLRDSSATNEVRLRLWEMKNGASVVSDQSLGSVFESDWKIRGIADFTGDGIAELFLRHATSNQVAIWEIENGQVVPGSTAPFGTVVSASWEHQSLADYDGDFHADILLRNTNAVAMWQMNGRTVINSDGFATTSSGSWRFHPGGTDGGAASMDLSAALRAAAAGPPLFVPVLPGQSPHLPSTPRPPPALPIGAGAPTWVPSFGPPTHIPPHAGPGRSSLADLASAEDTSGDTPTEIASSSTQTHRRSYSFYTPTLNLLATTTAALTATPTIAYEYVWFGSEPVAQWEATGTIQWYFNDHLGTPLLQTDASANVVWRVEYDPYGRVFAFRTGASKHQPLRFPGQESSPGSELLYNIHRWYRAGWGRYAQSDPLESASPRLFRSQPQANS